MRISVYVLRLGNKKDKGMNKGQKRLVCLKSNA